MDPAHARCNTCSLHTYPFEGEGLVEERVERLPVHLRLKLALLVGHQVDLDRPNGRENENLQ